MIDVVRVASGLVQVGCLIVITIWSVKLYRRTDRVLWLIWAMAFGLGVGAELFSHLAALFRADAGVAILVVEPLWAGVYLLLLIGMLTIRD